MDRPDSRPILPPGTSPTRRAAEKLEAALTWVCAWRYTTGTRMAQAVGTTNRRFVSRLVTRGYLRKVATGADPKTVLMLTREGRHKASEYTPHWQTYGLKARIGVSVLRHHLMVQDMVLRHLDDETGYTAERLIPELDIVDEKRPDALLHRGKRTVALEIELSYKAERRIYLGYRAYIRSFIRVPDAYGQVVYYFDDPAKRDYYRNLFNQTLWPVHERTADGRGWTLTDKQLVPDDFDGVRERFRFLMIDEPASFPMPSVIRTAARRRPTPKPPIEGRWYGFGRSPYPNLVQHYDADRQIVTFINASDTRQHSMRLWQWAKKAKLVAPPTIAVDTHNVLNGTYRYV